MRVSFRTGSVAFRYPPGFVEYPDVTPGSKTLHVGPDDGQLHAVLIVDLEEGNAEAGSFRIAIRVSEVAIEPSITLNEAKDQIAVVTGFEVVLVNVSVPPTMAPVRLSSPVFSVQRLSEIGYLAIHEIGVSRIDVQGRLVWSYERDIISSWRIVGGNLQVFFFEDSNPVVLRLSDGKVME